MGSVSAQSVFSGRLTIGVGVGSLPELKRSHCPCSTLLGNSLQSRVFEQSKSAGGVSSSKGRPGAVISQLKDEDRSKNDSRVFKSMQDATERREAEATAAAIASFDAADVARAIADAELLASSTSRDRALQPPRFATLRAFGAAGGQGVLAAGFKGNSVFELIAANIEASKQVKNWEVLSGRLAMLAISIALGVELYTGNSVFKGIDIQKLEAVAALCAVATLSAGGFAFAWRAKSDVVGVMARGSKNMVESAIDNLIDGLFFDEA